MKDQTVTSENKVQACPTSTIQNTSLNPLIDSRNMPGKKSAPEYERISRVGELSGNAQLA